MVITFLCKTKGNALMKSDESENIKWVSIHDLSQMLLNHPEKFYPMHVSALTKYVKSQQ